MDQATIDTLLAHVRAVLGGPGDRGPVEGYPDGLALCVLDALWHPDGTSDTCAAEEVLGVYRELREEDWGEPDTDGIADLLHQIELCGGPASFAEDLKKRYPNSSTRRGVLNSAAAVEAGELLIGADLLTAQAVRAASATQLGELERSWKRMAGQRTGGSFHRLLLLLDCPTLVPDRHLTAFVSAAVGADVDPQDAAAALRSVAAELGVPPQILAGRIRA